MTFPPTCIPSGQWSITRAYLTAIYVRCDQPGFSLSGNVLDFRVAGSPDALVIVTFNPAFWSWSSNSYTLDHMVDTATYEYPPNPLRRDLPFYLSILHDTEKPGWMLYVDAMYGADHVRADVPSNPGSYWTPGL